MSARKNMLKLCDTLFDMEAQNEDNIGNSTTGINALTDDCLRVIFSHVPMCELIFLHDVCSQWNSVLTEVFQAYVELTLFKRNYEVMGIDLKAYEKDCLEGNYYPSLGSAEIEMPDFDWDSQHNASFTKIYNRLSKVFSINKIRKLEIRGVTFPNVQLGSFLCHLTNLEHLSIFLDNLPYKKSLNIAYHVIIHTTQTQHLRHLMIALGGNSNNDIDISTSDLQRLYIDQGVLDNLESLYICDYSNSPSEDNIIKLNSHVLFGKLRHLAVAHNDSLFTYLSRLDSRESIFVAPKLSALLSLTHLTLHHNQLHQITAISLTSFSCLKKLTLSFSIWPNQDERTNFIMNYLTNIPASLKHLCINIVPNTLSFDFFPRNFVLHRLPPIQSFETIEIDCSRINTVDVELYPLLDVFKNWTNLRVNEKHYVADQNERLGYRLLHITKIVPRSIK